MNEKIIKYKPDNISSIKIFVLVLVLQLNMQIFNFYGFLIQILQKFLLFLIKFHEKFRRKPVFGVWDITTFDTCL